MDRAINGTYRAGRPTWLTRAIDYSLKPYRDGLSARGDRGDEYPDADSHRDGEPNRADLLPTGNGDAGAPVPSPRSATRARDAKLGS